MISLLNRSLIADRYNQVSPTRYCVISVTHFFDSVPVQGLLYVVLFRGFLDDFVFELHTSCIQICKHFFSSCFLVSTACMYRSWSIYSSRLPRLSMSPNSPCNLYFFIHTFSRCRSGIPRCSIILRYVQPSSRWSLMATLFNSCGIAKHLSLFRHKMYPLVFI